MDGVNTLIDRVGSVTGAVKSLRDGASQGQKTESAVRQEKSQSWAAVVESAGKAAASAAEHAGTALGHAGATDGHGEDFIEKTNPRRTRFPMLLKRLRE